jgi:hypothetical protein
VHLDYQGVWVISAEVLLSREEVDSFRIVQGGCLGKALPDLVGWNQNMEPVKSDVHTELVKQARSVAFMMYVQAAGCGVYCSCKSRHTCQCSDALLPDTLLTLQVVKSLAQSVGTLLHHDSLMKICDLHVTLLLDGHAQLQHHCD